MGQKTGTSNTEKKVITKATTKAFVIAYLKCKQINIMDISGTVREICKICKTENKI
jgi:ribosomal protein L11